MDMKRLSSSPREGAPLMSGRRRHHRDGPLEDPYATACAIGLTYDVHGEAPDTFIP